MISSLSAAFWSLRFVSSRIPVRYAWMDAALACCFTLVIRFPLISADKSMIANVTGYPLP